MEIPTSSSFTSSTSSTLTTDPSQQEHFRSLSNIFKIRHARTTEEQRELCFEAVRSCCEQELDWKTLKKASTHCAGLKDLLGRSVMQVLVSESEVSTVQAVLGHGLATALSDGNYQSCLHLAARCGRNDMVNVLANYIDIDKKNSEGKTALHVAVEAGQAFTVSLLLEKGASPTLTYASLEGEFSALTYAIRRGEIPCMDAIITDGRQHSSGAQLKKEGVSGVGNALHVAVQFGQQDVLEHLLNKHSQDAGKLIHAKNAQKLTPLCLAARNGETEAIPFLHRKGAGLGEADAKGWTPMHHAASELQRESIEWLSYLGAKVNAVNSQMQRPYDLVPEKHDLRAYLSLLEKGKGRKRLSPPNFATLPPHNLVFQGGGPKGVAFGGALQALEERGKLKEVVRLGGTSAGAITAALMAVNYTSDELLDLLEQTPLTDFLDHPLTKKRIKEAIKNRANIKLLWDAYQCLLNPKTLIFKPVDIVKLLWHSTGVCEGKVFREWIEKLIAKKTGITHCTFGELAQKIKEGKPFKHLHVWGIRIGQEPELVHFSSEDSRWKDLIISDAVRVSMSIPGIFKAYQLWFKDSHTKERYVRNTLGSFVDGGMLNNLPVETFDFKRFVRHGLTKSEGEKAVFNRRTLAFSLYTPPKKEIKPDNIDNVGSLLLGLSRVYTNAEQLIRQRNPYNRHRIVRISNEGVSLFQFNLKPEVRQALIRSGLNATNAFFQKATTLGALGSPKSPAPHKKQVSTFYSKAPDRNGIRRKLLGQRLYKELISDLAIPTKTKVCVLCGLPGAGKSELAKRLTDRNQGRFTFVHWIDCTSSESQNRGWRELAVALKLNPRGTPEHVQRTVISRLETSSDDRPWLLVLDNAQNKTNYPQSKGYVLVLSDNEKNWSSERRIQVPLFDEQERYHLLCSFTRRKDAALSQLAQQLTPTAGSLSEKNRPSERGIQVPLFDEQDRHHFRRGFARKQDEALSQLAQQLTSTASSLAAGYIVQTATTPQDYLQSLAEVKKGGKQKKALNMLESVLQTTLAHFSETKSLEAAQWIEFCAYLNSERIPASWARGYLGESANRILLEMSKHRLIRYDRTREEFDIPKAVQQATRALRSDPRKILSGALRLLIKQGARFDRKESTTWTYGHEWLPHASALLTHADRHELDPTARSRAYDIMGDIKSSLGDLHGAYAAYHKAIKLSLQAHDRHPVKILDKLANVCQSLSKVEEALKHYQTALEECNKIHLEPHKKVVDALINVGDTLIQLRRFDKAIPLFVRARDLLKEIHSGNSEHIRIGEMHLRIGQCVLVGQFEQTAFEKARTSFKEALRIFEANYTEETGHADIVKALKGIARALVKLNRKKEAIGFYQRCIDMCVSLHGQHHRSVKHLQKEMERNKPSTCIVA